MKFKPILIGAVVLLGLAYPFLIYFGLNHFSARHIALIIGIMLIVRFAVSGPSHHRGRMLAPVLISLTLCCLAFWRNDAVFIKFLPMLISLGLLISFGYTLFNGPSMVEVFARRITSELGPEQIRYCRRVTIVWCGFFILNGSIAGLTALWGSLYWWTLYNGFIAYIGIGLLFASEMTYRHWRFRHYVGLPTDPLFKKLFPPEE